MCQSYLKGKDQRSRSTTESATLPETGYSVRVHDTYTVQEGGRKNTWSKILDSAECDPRIREERSDIPTPLPPIQIISPQAQIAALRKLSTFPQLPEGKGSQGTH